MIRYSVEPRTREYIKGSRLLSFASNLSYENDKKLWAIATKAGLDAAKTTSKRNSP